MDLSPYYELLSTMPAYSRGKLRDKLTYVLVSGTKLFYGFKTKDFASLTGASISSGDLTALGHLTPEAVDAGGVRIISAASPKPPRVQKVINPRPTADQQGSVSTFCGKNSIRDAEAEQWYLVKTGRGVTLSNNARTKTVGAKLTGGGMYLFPMNATDVTNYASLLGLELPSAISSTERELAFSGTSRPRPARLKLVLEDGSTFSSFCSSSSLDNALQANFELLVPEIID